MEPYWEAVRGVYAPFEAGLASPTGTVYRHEIPGGQLSNLRTQATALGLGHRFEEVEQLYAACNELLGRPIKVTPSSKVVGDLALHLVASGVTPDDLAADPASADLPDSVIGFLHGELGTPPGGFPEPFRAQATEGRDWAPKTKDLTDDDAAGLATDRAATLNRLLFPTQSAAQDENTHRYGDLSVLPSLLFWYGLDPHDDDTAVVLGPGVRLLLGLRSIGEPNDEGIRLVSFRVNGQPRDIDTLDRTVAVDRAEHARADPAFPATLRRRSGARSTCRCPKATRWLPATRSPSFEAMKMESSISAPVSGTVISVAAATGSLLEPGDLIAEIRPAGRSGSPESEHDG